MVEDVRDDDEHDNGVFVVCTAKNKILEIRLHLVGYKKI
jgi:hypothetical protein